MGYAFFFFFFFRCVYDFCILYLIYIMHRTSLTKTVFILLFHPHRTPHFFCFLWHLHRPIYILPSLDCINAGLQYTCHVNQNPADIS